MSSKYKSMFLSPNDCAEVFAAHKARLEEALSAASRDGAVIAVVDPGLRPFEAIDLRGHGAWDSIILFQAAIGNPGPRPKDLALRKAYDALLRRDSFDEIANNHPATFVAGEIGWRGGLYKAGIALGLSGFSPDNADDDMAQPFLDDLVLVASRNYRAWLANRGQHLAESDGRMRQLPRY